MDRPLYSSPFDGLQDSILNKPEAIAYHLIEANGDRFDLSYRDVLDLATRAKGFYQGIGIRESEVVILALTASRAFLALYLAALAEGIIPLVVSFPTGAEWPDGASEKLAQLAVQVNACAICVAARPEQLPDSLKKMSIHVFPEFEDLSPVQLQFSGKQPDHIAHYQATSGSTGNPKIAIVRHGNLAANVLGIGHALGHRAEDKLVSWLPLSHDMGLVGLSYSLYWQCPLIWSPPSKFVRNPFFWLRMISDYQGTLSPAPNSAFHICARLAQRRRFTGIDLSSWRVALCGSEPVYEETMLAFQRAFKVMGYRAETMLPVYGLAEATLAVSIPKVDEQPYVESIDAELLRNEPVATLAGHDGPGVKRMVNVGQPIIQHALRIADNQDQPVPNRHLGEVQVKGPSIISGYLSNEAATRAAMTEDGFLRTGDIGYLSDEGLYILGRKKEIIIIHGKNYAYNDIENQVKNLLDRNLVREVVAFAAFRSDLGSEQLHLAIEGVPRVDETFRSDASSRIQLYLADQLELKNVQIHWAQKGTIPKTTSGKLQRHLCSGLFLS